MKKWKGFECSKKNFIVAFIICSFATMLLTGAGIIRSVVINSNGENNQFIKFMQQVVFAYSADTSLLTNSAQAYSGNIITVSSNVKIEDSETIPPVNLTERATAPSSPITEDIYLDDGSNTISGLPGFRRYTGSGWEDLGGGGITTGTQSFSGNKTFLDQLKTATAIYSDNFHEYTADADITFNDEVLMKERLGLDGFDPADYNANLVMGSNSTIGQMVIFAATGSSARIFLGDSDNSSSGQIRYNNSSDSMSFYTDNTERASIDNAGTFLCLSNIKTATSVYSDDFYEYTGSAGITLNDNVIASESLTLATGATVTEFSTDGTLAGNSDIALPTEKAVKTYADSVTGAGTDTTAIHDDTASEISAIAAKANPTTSDYIIIEDAAATNSKKSTTLNALPISSDTQSALDAKAPIADPTFTGEIGIGAVNVSETELGILEGATLSTTELNYVDNVTSAIQTQLDAKVSSTITVSEKTQADDPYAVLDTDYDKILVLGRATTADTSFVLPTLADNLGKKLSFKNSSSYVLTIQGENVGSDAVEAGTTATVIAATAHGFTAGQVLVMTSGDESGETRRIDSVTTDAITLENALSDAPSSTETFAVYEAIDGDYKKELGKYESLEIVGGDLTADEWIKIGN